MNKNQLAEKLTNLIPILNKQLLNEGKDLATFIFSTFLIYGDEETLSKVIEDFEHYIK